MYTGTETSEYGYTAYTTDNKQSSFSARSNTHMMISDTVMSAVSVFVLVCLSLLVPVSVLPAVIVLVSVRLIRSLIPEMNTQCEAPRRPARIVG